MATVLNVPGLSGFGDTLFSLTGASGTTQLPRNIRRNPAFRDVFSLGENTPFQIGGGTGTGVLESLLGGAALPSTFTFQQPSAPPLPDFFSFPGIGTFRNTGGGFVLEEDPEVKARRLEREAAVDEFQKILTEGLTEGELANIQETAKTFEDRTFKRAERLLRQNELGRGRAGSALQDANIDLATEVGERSQLLSEDLEARRLAATQNALLALQGGLDAQAARSLQAQGLAQSDLAGRDALNANLAFSGAQFQPSLNLSLLGALSGRDLSLRGLSQNALNQRDALGQSNRNRQSQKFSDLAGIGGSFAGRSPISLPGF